MKRTGKLLLGSALAIAFSASLIAGSTLALFSGESQTNIAITSGQISATAGVSAMEISSGGDGWAPATDIGNGWSGESMSGGSMTYMQDEAMLTLRKLTPGDAVKLTIDIKNDSTISVRYQIRILVKNEGAIDSTIPDEHPDAKLSSALAVTLGGETLNGLWCKAGEWSEPVTARTTIDDQTLIFRLPDSADDVYRGKRCNIGLSVKVIQSNAKTTELCDEQGHTYEDGVCKYCGAKRNEYNGEEMTYSVRNATVTGGEIQGDGDGFVGAMQPKGTISYRIHSDEECLVLLSVNLSGGKEYVSGDGWGGWNGTLAEAFTVTAGDTVLGPFDLEATNGTEMPVGYLLLQQGTNEVTITAGATVSGNLNFNSLKLSPVPVFSESYSGETALTLEAEQATLFGSCNVQEGAGWTSGDKFVGAIANGAEIVFAFHAETAGTAELYAAISRGDSTLTDAFDIFVNGAKVSGFDAQNSGAWQTVKEFYACEVKLKEGLNVIELRAVNTNGQVNLDYIRFATEERYSGSLLTLEAETATLSGCNTQNSWEKEYVGGIGSGATITFRFRAATAGKVALYLSAGSENNIPNAFNVTVNGGDPTVFAFNRVGSNSWLDFCDTFVCHLDLVEGTVYTVTFANTAAQGGVNNNLNVDCLKILPASRYTGETLTLGAANAAVSGKCNIQPNGSGADGHIIGDISAGNSSRFSFSVYSENETAVMLDVFAAYQGDYTLEIVVNGVSVEEGSGNTGNWTNFASAGAKQGTLRAGWNIIEIRAKSGNFNFSHIRVSPVE